MGRHWYNVFMYVAMSVCVGWNTYNFFTYTGSIYNRHGLLAAISYTLLCLFGACWCAWVMARLYKNNKKLEVSHARSKRK